MALSALLVSASNQEHGGAICDSTTNTSNNESSSGSIDFARRSGLLAVERTFLLLLSVTIGCITWRSIATSTQRHTWLNRDAGVDIIHQSLDPLVCVIVERGTGEDDGSLKQQETGFWNIGTCDGRDESKLRSGVEWRQTLDGDLITSDIETISHTIWKIFKDLS